MTDKKLPLIELFGPTIQGEGTMCGKVTHFLRLGICDSKCTMCDSKHAVDPEQIKKWARYLTIPEILDEIALLPKAPWMTLTGGNPCVHNLADLVTGIQAMGMKVALETQGTFFPSWVHKCNLVTISPKGPGMGEMFNENLYEPWADFQNEMLYMRKEQPSTWAPETCLKVVVFNEQDLAFAKYVWDLTPDVPLFLSLGNSWLPDESDVTGDEHVLKLTAKYREMAELLYKDPVLCNARFLPQLHTLIWSNDKGR